MSVKEKIVETLKTGPKSPKQSCQGTTNKVRKRG
jgi:hypothetical protein